jgi:predicted amidohydrolase
MACEKIERKNMKIHLAQLIVENDLAVNFAKIRRVMAGVQAGEWVVFPEASLSGYFPDDPAYTSRLNAAEIEAAVGEIHDLVRARGCFCVLGTARQSQGKWENAAVVLSPIGPAETYAKIQLSALDARHFRPGPFVPVFHINGVRVGIQLCRELLFPSQWAQLRQAGVKMVIHLNNAIKPHDAIWEHVVITRALEHAMYVCSVNNAAPPQELTSYLVAPNGKLLLKAAPQTEEVLTANIDLATVVQNVGERSDF